jgi:Zn-dependent metalloprotease
MKQLKIPDIAVSRGFLSLKLATNLDPVRAIKSKLFFHTVLLLFFIVLFSGLSIAQTENLVFTKDAQSGRTTFVQVIGTQSADNSKAVFASSTKNLPVSNSKDPVKIADDFLKMVSNEFKITNPSSELKVSQVEQDQAGMSHVRYQQIYQNVPVFGGEILVHMKEGKVTSASNSKFEIESISTTPKLTAKQAEQFAIKAWQSELKTSLNPNIFSTTLYVYPVGIIPGNIAIKKTTLVWEVHLGLERLTSDKVYYINADDGTTVFDLTRVKNAAQSRLVGDCTPYKANPLTGWTNATGACGNYDLVYQNYRFGRRENASAVGTNPIAIWRNTFGPFAVVNWSGTDVDDAYTLQGLFNQYLALRFNRTGVNNWNGSCDGIGTTCTKNYTRAFVYTNGIYGNNSGCPNAAWAFGTPQMCASSLLPDLFSHEYSHGILDYRLNLTWNYAVNEQIYYGDSGATEESFADMMGDAFEQYLIDIGRQDWEGMDGNWTINIVKPSKLYTITNESINENSTPPVRTMVRNFANPGDLVYRQNSSSPWMPYPDRTYSPSFYCGPADLGGLHINSLVASKANYLMSVGGTFNGCTVSPISREKMIQILYRSGMLYYPRWVGFQEVVNNNYQACLDLYGGANRSVNTPECIQLMRAFQATEMDQGTCCNYTIHNIDTTQYNNSYQTGTCSIPRPHVPSCYCYDTDGSNTTSLAGIVSVASGTMYQDSCDNQGKVIEYSCSNYNLVQQAITCQSGKSCQNGYCQTCTTNCYPPILQPIGNRTLNEMSFLTIQLNATDADGNNLTYGTNAYGVLPSGFDFNSATGLFNWHPTSNDAGIYSVNFNVSDGQFSNEETIKIEVLDWPCRDSDNGLNYSVRGTMFDFLKGKTGIDSCRPFDRNTLGEYYCLGGSGRYEIVECSSLFTNYVCDEGVCVAGLCNYDEICQWNENNASCNADCGFDANITSCSDSDVSSNYLDGLDPYTKGTAITNLQNKTDYCANSQELREMYCTSDNQIGELKNYCADQNAICSNGACVVAKRTKNSLASERIVQIEVF